MIDPLADLVRAPVLPKIPLALGAAAVGALVGGWLMSLAAAWVFYVPLIPGAVAGYAVHTACRSDRFIVSLIAALFGFAGMVFGDALTFDLAGYPGVWNYVTHFWYAATPIKGVFWLANAALGFWFSRAQPGEDVRGFPVMTDRCRACGRQNASGARFCSHCGQAM